MTLTGIMASGMAGSPAPPAISKAMELDMLQDWNAGADAPIVSGPSSMTFDRASTGLVWGEDGYIHAASSGAPRFDHVPNSATPKGLLLEPSRENILLYTDSLTSFQNAYWNNGGMTFTGAVGPDNVADSAINVPSAGTGWDTFYNQTGIPNTGTTTYVMSFFCQKTSGAPASAGFRITSLVGSGFNNNNAFASWNTDSGVPRARGSEVTDHWSEDFGMWWRFVYVVTMPDTVTEMRLNLVPNYGSPDTTSTWPPGGSQDTKTIWVPQIEAIASGPVVPSSPLPTAGATVTRLAETYGPGDYTWVPNNDGESWVFEGELPKDKNSALLPQNDYAFVYGNAGGTSTAFKMDFDSSHFEVSVGATAPIIAQIGTSRAGPFKVGYAYDSVGGTLTSLDASDGPAPAANGAQQNNWTGWGFSSQFIWARKFRLFDGALDQDTLNTETT